jgi:hypothetical protein
MRSRSRPSVGKGVPLALYVWIQLFGGRWFIIGRCANRIGLDSPRRRGLSVFLPWLVDECLVPFLKTSMEGHVAEWSTD